MKLTYLGTAASEGWPALFCDCPICLEAQKRGGKDHRNRACALIDSDLLIDVSPDLYAARVRLDVSLSGVRTLLITHSHADHFALPQMGWYAPNFRKAARLEPLVIAGSEKTGEAYRAMYEAWNSRFTRDWLRFQVLRPFEPTELNNARVTLFPAQHGADGASVYRIERDGQSILYLHDTGLIYDEVWADLKRHAPVSLVSLDAVCGPNRASEGSGHMSFVQDAEIRERMLAEGVANDKTLFVSNHICIHCCTSNGAFIFHEDMENILRPLGLIPSYDGLSIDLSL